MATQKYLSLLTLALLALLALYISPAEACSCMQTHPQTQFCNADYAILARVLRTSNRLVANSIVYKVKIKKIYKMNADGEKILKHGRLVTSNSEAMCGVKMEIGRLYVIAGKTNHLNMCNYIKEYVQMSVVERHGFSSRYGKSCKCEIRPCFSGDCLRGRETKKGCKWSPFNKCETFFSGCSSQVFRTSEGRISTCLWQKTPYYQNCIAERTP